MYPARDYLNRVVERAFLDWMRVEGGLMTVWALFKSVLAVASASGIVQDQIGALPWSLPGWLPAVIFGFLVFVVAPYGVWREERERADNLREKLDNPLDLWVQFSQVALETIEHEGSQVDEVCFWALNATITNRSGRPVSLRPTLSIETPGEDYTGTGDRLYRPEDFDWWERDKRGPTQSHPPFSLENGKSTGRINIMLQRLPKIFPFGAEDLNRMKLRVTFTDTSTRGNPSVEVYVPTDAKGVEVVSPGQVTE